MAGNRKPFWNLLYLQQRQIFLGVKLGVVLGRQLQDRAQLATRAHRQQEMPPARRFCGPDRLTRRQPLVVAGWAIRDAVQIGGVHDARLARGQPA